MVLDQFGLVVEQVLLGRSSGHVQIDDSLGLGREVRRPGLDRVVGRARGTGGFPLSALARAAASFRSMSDRRRNGAQSGLRCLEELAAGLCPRQLQVDGQFGSMGSTFGQHAVEVQEYVGDRGPRGQLGWFHAGGKRASGSVASDVRRLGSLRYRSYSACVESDERVDLFGPGRPAQAELQGRSGRDAVTFEPPSRTIRRASAWAAST